VNDKKILSRNKNFKEEQIEMKSSRIFKGGAILLIIALAVGIFTAFIIDDLRREYRFCLIR